MILYEDRAYNVNLKHYNWMLVKGLHFLNVFSEIYMPRNKKGGDTTMGINTAGRYYNISEQGFEKSIKIEKYKCIMEAIIRTNTYTKG